MADPIRTITIPLKEWGEIYRAVNSLSPVIDRQKMEAAVASIMDYLSKQVTR